MMRIALLLVVFIASVVSARHKALDKILVEENPDTEENRERINAILNRVRQNRGRVQGRSPFSTFQKPDKKNLPAKNINKTEINEVNKDIHEYTFEGDIMLNTDQANALTDEAAGGRKKRQATTDPTKYWDIDTPIYYTFHPKLTPAKIASIRKGIQFWNDNTCLTFKENSTGPNRLYFTSAGGCWSSVGKQGTSYQLVSIGDGCEGLGTVTHEIAHALGFWHQQSRYDRDRYLYIDFNNIQSSLRYNFDKLPLSQASLLDQPYDYGSVMQYGAYSFAQNPYDYTIYARQQEYQNTLGQREKPAFSDIQMVNKLYQCEDKRCSTKLACQNGGFTDSRNCSQCICPMYFGGQLCDELPVGDAVSCNGQVVEATQKWQKFNLSAGDKNSYTYLDTPQTCYWIIKAPIGKRVLLNILNTDTNCLDGCPWQSVEMNSGNYQTYGMTICCSTFQGQTYSSTNNTIAIRSVVRYNTVTFGFQYRYY